MQSTIVQYCYFESPIGQLLLAGSNSTLLLLGLPQGKLKQIPQAHWLHDPNTFAECKRQLSEYFAGQRKDFKLEYIIQGTEFKRNVLNKVAQIPYGKTASYSEIAKLIKNPAAIRAVGGANATNPLPIIVPCHRVIGKNGSLTGFGGGLPTKRYLLELEDAQIASL